MVPPTYTSPLTLSVDCGGGSIKSAVCAPDGTLVTPPTITPTHYPFAPVDLVTLVAKLITDSPVQVDRITVGNGKRGDITKRLQDEFFKIIRAERPAPGGADWLTVVGGGTAESTSAK